MVTSHSKRKYGDTDFFTGMRAGAVLLVFLIHSDGSGLRLTGSLGNFLVECGKFGVQIFFVVSGYTIFSQFFKEENTLKKFLLSRFIRISLPYYPLIRMVFLWAYLGKTPLGPLDFHLDALNLIAHLTYLSAYKLSWQNSILGVEWTLAVEVFFYLVFGILIRTGVLNQSAKSLILFGAAALFSSVGCLIATRAFNVNIDFVHFMPWRIQEPSATT